LLHDCLPRRSHRAECDLHRNSARRSTPVSPVETHPPVASGTQDEPLVELLRQLPDLNAASDSRCDHGELRRWGQRTRLLPRIDQDESDHVGFVRTLRASRQSNIRWTAFSNANYRGTCDRGGATVCVNGSILRWHQQENENRKEGGAQPSQGHKRIHVSLYVKVDIWVPQNAHTGSVGRACRGDQYRDIPMSRFPWSVSVAGGPSSTRS